MDEEKTPKDHIFMFASDIMSWSAYKESLVINFKDVKVSGQPDINLSLHMPENWYEKLEEILSDFYTVSKINEYLFDLSTLAASWRGYIGTESEKLTILDSYTDILKKLYQLGWDGFIDIDSQLPDEFMPDIYKHKKSQTDKNNIWDDPNDFYTNNNDNTSERN